MYIETRGLERLEFELKTTNLTSFLKETLRQATPENCEIIEQLFRGGVGQLPINIITTDKTGSFGIQLNQNGRIGISIQTLVQIYISTEIFWDTFVNISSVVAFGYTGGIISLSDFTKNKLEAIREIASWTDPTKTINECLAHTNNKHIFTSFIRLGNDRNGDAFDNAVNDIYWLSVAAFMLHEISHSRNMDISNCKNNQDVELCCDRFAFKILIDNIDKFELTSEEKLKGYTKEDAKVKRLIALALMFFVIIKFFDTKHSSHPDGYSRIRQLIDCYEKQPDTDLSDLDGVFRLRNNFWNVLTAVIVLILHEKAVDLNSLQHAPSAKDFCLENLNKLRNI